MATKEMKEAPSRTSYEEIEKLQKEIGAIDGHSVIPRKDSSFSHDEHSGGVALSLDDGSLIKIEHGWSEGRGARRSVQIGGVKLYVELWGDATLYQSTEFPVQLQIGSISESGKATSNLRVRLGLPEQRIVLNWIKTSIKQRKLGESPIKVNILPQAQKAKS